MKILSTKNLCKNYHTKAGEIEAVKNFNIDVNEGEIIAIVGPSGCGKSTILSTLCGLESISDGNIIFEKDDIKLGYMLQRDSLFPWLTVLDNCLLGLRIKKNITAESKERVIKLLNTYGLSEFINHYPDQLSGGMRQRVG